jgi:O-antigen/teichoic acid export membrane protein
MVYFLLLRLLTLCSRFLLSTEIARLLDPTDVGKWALYSVTIAFSATFLALDFSTYFGRELQRYTPDEVCNRFYDYSVFLGILAILLLPASALLFKFGYLDAGHIALFYLVLIGEHVAMEGFRLLTAMGRIGVANLVLFLKQGAWVVVVVSFMFARPDLASVKLLLGCWFVGCILAFVIAGISLSDLPWRSFSRRKIDWSWIISGAKVGLLLFLGGLASRAMPVIDRHFVDHYLGSAAVAVYAFYYGVTSSMGALIESGVSLKYYRKLLGAAGDNDMIHLRSCATKALLEITGVASFFVVAYHLVINRLLEYIGRSVYAEFSWLGWVLIGACLIRCYGVIFQYSLVGFCADRANMIISTVGLLFFIAISCVCGPRFGLAGLAAGLLSSNLLVLTLQGIVLVNQYNRRLGGAEVAAP